MLPPVNRLQLPCTDEGETDVEREPVLPSDHVAPAPEPRGHSSRQADPSVQEAQGAADSRSPMRPSRVVNMDSSNVVLSPHSQELLQLAEVSTLIRQHGSFNAICYIS